MKITQKRNSGIQEAVSRRLRTRRPVSFSLRMTPMIDMIFLLLIFFLLTVNFRPMESFLPFQLPAAQAQAGHIEAVEPLVIYIFDTEVGCQVQIGQIAAIQLTARTMQEDLALFAQKTADIMHAQRRTTEDPIEIVCTGDIEWQYVAKICNVLFGMGIKDITFRMTD